MQDQQRKAYEVNPQILDSLQTIHEEREQFMVLIWEMSELYLMDHLKHQTPDCFLDLKSKLGILRELVSNC